MKARLVFLNKIRDFGKKLLFFDLGFFWLKISPTSRLRRTRTPAINCRGPSEIPRATDPRYLAFFIVKKRVGDVLPTYTLFFFPFFRSETFLFFLFFSFFFLFFCINESLLYEPYYQGFLREIWTKNVYIFSPNFS
uniref:hypothetical protein n=1 Tax=Cephaleuros karstenii TaxID=1985640 RepID=UPI001EDCBA63|nr:hypothetical protein MFR52_pgp003 [Cephaleuros karstenii]UIB39061.1 hypothetical protein [Cephaleuros karstenii]